MPEFESKLAEITAKLEDLSGETGIDKDVVFLVARAIACDDQFASELLAYGKAYWDDVQV